MIDYLGKKGEGSIQGIARYDLLSRAWTLAAEKSLSLYGVDYYYENALLHLAVDRGYIDFVIKFLASYPKLADVEDRFGRTIVHDTLIAKYKILGSYRKCCEKDIDFLEKQQVIGDFDILITNFKEECAELNHKYNSFLSSLMQYEPDSNDGIISNFDIFLKRDNAGISPLGLAIKAGDLRLVKDIMEHAATVEMDKSDSGYILSLISPYQNLSYTFYPGTAKFVRDIHHQIAKGGYSPEIINYADMEKYIMGCYDSFDNILY